MFAVYITHPQVRIDPDVPVPQWGLSDLGQERTRRTADAAWVRQLGRIVSSPETKAVETAAILAGAANIGAEQIETMHENDRSATGFLTPPEFEKAADWFFAHTEESFYGWERAIDAQARIVRAIQDVLGSHDPAVPIAFIGHGGVGTLLKCHLQGQPISRSGDQPPGGGNLFCFTLADLTVTCDWTAMEIWQGDR
ncbi:histidine phosphatase family protein [Agrobacterium vitis]|uniref:Histidine phosphatase family protein n=1 Tax=Agrobacterium vitis TaxID=373 RepID=A0AAE4WDH1_AGRVI|nr:histidine phosphatase family protein [Agrobacterium vitis]MCF1499251.1 histidine phosphatase family protein [Allorhizobium sp. Av2]MCM2439503.1 histidine phosphatase family protein [Agrobacterium vitis]MUZ57598.1 histidine phosphatase family protein [Agrobacterium vitis]MVA68157.1 histidine phosphatase family protein [Agrobacterium vitis]MVA87819.1 histidine phosphatase family protein [Agrobacterium vitis]